VSDHDEYANEIERDAVGNQAPLELMSSEKQRSERSPRLGSAMNASSVASAAASFFLSISIFFFLLLASTAFFHPDAAWAVQSGGRMGGSFGSGSSSRSSSSGSSSRQYSGSSYGRSYGGGGGGGYYSRPNIIVSPGISPFYSPFYNPFYSPFYAPRPPGVVVVGSGPSFGGIIFFAGFFFLAAMVLSNMGNSVRDTLGDKIGSRMKFGNSSNDSILGPGISVVELSVALQVPDRDSPSSILSALHRLSNTARTDSRVGLQNLTSQVALELLRRKSSIVAASTLGRHYSDKDEGGRAQRAYNDISIRERSKFQRETVSKYGGVDYGSSDIKKTTSATKYASDATIAVVTIIMLIDGDSTSKALSSNVNSLRDVEDALSRIAADAKADACLRSAEILWTPEERSETLTMKEVLADYSNLRSV